MRIMNSKGKRGSPCLMPRVGGKGIEGDPLTRIDNLEDLIRARVQLIHLLDETKSI